MQGAADSAANDLTNTHTREHTHARANAHTHTYTQATGGMQGAAEAAAKDLRSAPKLAAAAGVAPTTQEVAQHLNAIGADASKNSSGISGVH